MADQTHHYNHSSRPNESSLSFGEYGPSLDGMYGPPQAGEYGNSEARTDSFERGNDYDRDSTSTRRRSSGDHSHSRTHNHSDKSGERRRHRDRSRSRSRSRSRRSSRSRSRSRSHSRSRSRERRRRNRDRGDRGDRDERQKGDVEFEREYYGRDEGMHRSRPIDRTVDQGSHGTKFRHRHEEDGRSEHTKRTAGNDWRSKLTSIRDAHFNRNKQAPMAAQNTFKNDGSFLEMFKRKMAGQGEDASSSVTPNSLVLASSSIPFSDGLSLPPLTATPIQDVQNLASSSTVDDQDVDGVPMETYKAVPMPKSVGKRRLAKPLKTGIVFKKPQEPAEDEASQEKLDAWSRYLQEVQRYKSANCTDEDKSRPLVK